MGDDLTAVVAGLVEKVQAEYPDLDLSPSDFAAALASHAPADDAAAFYARVHAPELALATAAGRGSSSAIATLERVHGNVITFACRRFAGRGHTEDDLRQVLRSKLFVAEPGAQPTIALYNGQGSLESWIRVIATRLFIDLGRRKDRARETSSDPAELDVIEPSDLALDAIKAEYRSAVAAALDEAVRQLATGDRHLLRQHLVAGLTIDQLSAVMGVHRATVARRIGRARDTLIEKTRELVQVQLELDERELGELFGLVISKLDLSMKRLLATPQPR